MPLFLRRSPLLFFAASLSSVLAQSTVFEADFEASTSANIGTIDYNAGATTTAVATQVPVATPGDPTLGDSVLWLDRNSTGLLNARFDFTTPVDLTTATATLSFDVAARRTVGASKTHLLYGYDSSNTIVFALVLGESSAFGNGNDDRQRPGFETLGGGRQVLPAPSTPGAFWWGNDGSEASFDETKDAHFELTIEANSWDLTTTQQNGTTIYSTSGLPTFDGSAASDLAYFTLTTYTGTNFGNYWDNFLVTSTPLPPPPASTYYYTGNGDGSSLFLESNWTENSDGSGSTIPSINGGTSVNLDLVIASGNAGGGGASGELKLGTGNLLLSGGALNFNNSNGLSEGTVTLNGGTINAAYICDTQLTATAGTVSLNGSFLNSPITCSGGNLTATSLSDGSDATQASGSLTLTSFYPFDSSTVDFESTSTGTVDLTALSPGEVTDQWLSHFTVDGSAAVLSGAGKNLAVLPNGSGGTLVVRYDGFVDTDSDNMDDEWEMSFFGNLARDGSGDLDNDGLTDLAEFTASTNPASSDTDGDLLDDFAEINSHNTDPTNSDSDGDSNPDGFEIAKNTDPNDDTSRTEQPNILFIFADDLGYGDLGVLHQNAKSGKKHKTPFMDQMAADGLILDRHYCPAPVCAPSRGSLLTGMHQGHANVRNNQFDKALENNHNLATTLKAAGYSTSIIGKWGVQGGGGSPGAWPAYPTKRGFDYFFGYVGHGAGHTHYPFHLTQSRDPMALYDQDKMIRDDLSLCFTPDLFTARAKKLIIDEVNDGDDQPFFLYLAYNTPHAALQIPTIEYPGENNADDLDDSNLGVLGGVQWIGTPGNMINTATGTLDSYRHPDYTTAVGNSFTDVEERFATLVRRMDDNLGDLRKTLEDLGIADNTLIILTSDNGPHSEDYLSTAQTNDGSSYLPSSFESYGPFEGIKRDCWEGGIREPSLVCWPNTVPASSITTQHSQFHDWMPTLCEVAGIPSPARTDGVSLLPTILSPNSPSGQKTPTTYIEYSTNGSTPNYSGSNHGGDTRTQAQVIFLDGYKGIRVGTANANDNFEIYETISDPGEGTNLAGTSTYFIELQQRMKDRVLQLRVPGENAARPYDNVEIPLPSTLPSLQPGLNYASYSGFWPWTPEFEDLAPVTTGTLTNGLELAPLPTSPGDDGLYLNGYLNIPSSGNWTFTLSSDSGAILKIHDILVLDDDYNHDGSSVSNSLNLAAGQHPVRIYYRNRSSATPTLSLRWSGPGVTEQDIPASAFFIEGEPDPIPVVTDDNATTSSTDSSVNPVTISPLDNDLDDGLPSALTISSFAQPAGGTVVQSGDDLIFTPSLGVFGPTSFAYTVTDGENLVSGTITVTVNYEADDIWLPFQECGGLITLRANGETAGSLFSSAVRTTGQHGYAINFNGSDSDFSLPGLTELPVGDSPRTLMAWIRVPIGVSTENTTLFGYGVNSNGERFSFRLNGGASSSSPGTPQQPVRLEVQGGSIVGNTPVDDGNWHHIAIVCDDFNNDGNLNVNETRIYVDGVLDTDPTGGIPAGSAAGRVINTASGTTATLGGSNHAATYSFIGDIDEFRVFPRALSTAEVLAHATATQQVAGAWHRRYFGNAPLTNWSSDDDLDGFNRLAEYAFGGLPWTPDSQTLTPDCSYSPGQISLTFRRRTLPELHNLTYLMEGSTDLVTWPLDSAEVSSSLLSEIDCLEQVTTEINLNSPPDDKQFARIRAELTP